MKQAFSLVELAVVLAVLGFIAVGIMRVLPDIERQKEAVEEGKALREAAKGIFTRAKMGGSFEFPDNLTATSGDTGNNFFSNSKIMDDYGRGLGYLPARDITAPHTSCDIAPQQRLSLRYCKNSVSKANCNQSTAQGDLITKIDNVSFVMFSNDPEFKSRIKVLKPNGQRFSNLDDYKNYTGEIVVTVAAGRSAAVVERTYQEVWDVLNCPSPISITDGNIISARASDTTDFAAFTDWSGIADAIMEYYYDYTEIPMNFLGIKGAEYCFEKYRGTKNWDFVRAYTNQNNNSGVCYDGSQKKTWIYSSTSCTRGTIQAGTLKKDDVCAGQFAGDPTNAGSNAYKNSCWYTDTDYMKYMACPAGRRGTNYEQRGNGIWSDVRVVPGWRGNCRDAYDEAPYCYALGNRVFTAYAKLPGSERLYKQNFAIAMRAMEAFWKGDDPYYWYGGDDLEKTYPARVNPNQIKSFGDEFWKREQGRSAQTTSNWYQGW